MKVLPFTRTHRTALVVDIRRGTDPEFEERVTRLFQSVGGKQVSNYNGDSGIKVDVFTLTGPEAVLTQGTTLPSTSTVTEKAEVVTLSPGSPFSIEKSVTPASTDSESVVLATLDDTLAKAGYVQVLHVRNLKAKK